MEYNFCSQLNQRGSEYRGVLCKFFAVFLQHSLAQIKSRFCLLFFMIRLVFLIRLISPRDERFTGTELLTLQWQGRGNVSLTCLICMFYFLLF